MTVADAERAEIIRYWRTVELFSPQSVNPVSRERRMFNVKPGQPLPWEPGHELSRVRLRPGQAWRHAVYVGVFSLESVFEVLARVFTPDADSFDERPSGESALAAFVVSGEGRPLIGSEVLSSCAWATGRVLHPGPGTPGWSSGFDGARAEFGTEFEELMAADEDDEWAERLRRRGHEVGRPISVDDLGKCRHLVSELAGVEMALQPGEIRVQSQVVSKRKAYNVDGHDFLNSLIVDDLAKVAERAGTGSIGGALEKYLRPNAALDTSRRVDVQKNLDTVLRATAPDQVPLGRWPEKSGYPLALSQQLAVGSALSMQDHAAVLGVNGPPGTGKTTMLRDLIAALVVQRACRLAELARPEDAFTGQTHTWKTGDRTRVIHEWIPELGGFEIAVASSNNGAVENVTNEIPAADSIGDSWREAAAKLDYFPSIASALLAIGDEEADGDQAGSLERAWALIAARLGNKNNRSTFVDTFWYRKPETLIGVDNDDDPLAGLSDEDRAQCGMWTILKSYERSTPTNSWDQAVADFRKSLDEASAIQVRREQVHANLTRKARLDGELRRAREAQARAKQRETELRGLLVQVERTMQSQQAQRHHQVQRRVEHHQFQPGLMQWLLTLGRALREWREKDQKLAAAIDAADEALSSIDAERERVAREAEQAGHSTAVMRQVTQDCADELATVTAALSRARDELGDFFPNSDWWSDRTRREIGALWTDPAWNDSRTELFLAALRLHKAFLQHAPTQMRQSLHGATDILGGAAPRDLPENTALNAWRSLFFVVPVVSTTFASFARLFSHLRQEALGWLLIDEAGQATPQAAVGALWRSKRAVAVGDPLQLEPITTLPFRAEQAIRHDHGVDEQWLTSRTSVQRLADRLTLRGTHLPGDDGQIWVGSPLTVHRRCDQPMFDIVNTVAYNGLMIDGTPPTKASTFTEEHPSLPPSKWIDVVSDQSQGHWVPDEGNQLDHILSALDRLDIAMSEVMVIGPFRDIARQIERRTDDYPGLTAGTIHTAQGKQADIVILVLGSDPQRPGARRWAAQKPNLINVAVSRAKRRLYVIGNHGTWSQQRHFDTLARHLPHLSPK